VLDVPIGEMWLVAADSWDVASAARVGCRTAFVARPCMVLDTLWSVPDIVAPDIGGVADTLIAREA
jgi:2-haloacid dehalogenase